MQNLLTVKVKLMTANSKNTQTINWRIRLSPYHEAFYREWQLDPNSSTYNIVFDQTLSSDLDVAKLQFAMCNFVLI